MVNTVLLRRAGLKSGEYEEHFAKNPPNASFGSYLKQADAAGVGDAVLTLPLVKKKVDVEKMKFIGKSEQMPHLPWAAKKTISKEDLLKLQDAFLSLNSSEVGRKILANAALSGIDIATDSEYDIIRKLAKEYESYTK
ncbi:MAG: phosphate/phosphite/phosphonate ABC transporter substrate-binding protein [Gammaproteobacteria bacterium]|nr:phosphate/phosphite/phosphonate ABC transporter substrate-binding protein [Gammaproteobacteria bacterium]